MTVQRIVSRGIDDAASAVRRSDAPLWLVLMAKLGYASRGIVYLVIGALALFRAAGWGGDTANTRAALRHVLGATGGTALLWVLTAGLGGYALWRLCQSLLDADDKGDGPRALAARAGLFISACTHGGLGVYAGYLATHAFASDSGQDGPSVRSLSAMVLGWPGGSWLVAGAGVCVVIVGTTHFVRSFGIRFADPLVLSRRTLTLLAPICKFGLVARGLALVFIGALAIHAGLTQQPDEAGGLREVLQGIAAQPFGAWLLGAMGSGLMAFGLYSLIESAFREIDGPGDG
ncbi:DUF1206 domain-containing protein [Nitrogeniibacter aestuarii]|uniref:DUF1206 domain-containing protein n=1 Tax=Nitrogeniibacter aestuarii TaxID=2815343 RepID=UPI001D1069FB|nr:DUF1206 domain-containing protein [Nitrogeniibacter aestuarii]